MINVLPARTSHVDMIEPKDFFLDNPRILDEVRAAVQRDHCVSFISEDGVILAIVGMTKIYAKTAEFWALTSDHCDDYPMEFAKKSKRVFESFIHDAKLKRMQMVVRSGLAKELDYAIFLGFIPEGILRSYGPEGADYIMLGRVV